jgi:hypothetical protein
MNALTDSHSDVIPPELEAYVPPPELEAYTKAILEHAMTGKPLDPAIAKWVREESEKMRQEIFRKHGLVDIAVPAVREFRGEIPWSTPSILQWP